MTTDVTRARELARHHESDGDSNLVAEETAYVLRTLAADLERCRHAAALALEALCLDSGGVEQVEREQNAIRMLAAIAKEGKD